MKSLNGSRLGIDQQLPNLAENLRPCKDPKSQESVRLAEFGHEVELGKTT